MKNSIVLKIILGLCGLAFLAAGGFSLLNPVGFTARNGVDIVGNMSLLNDYRGLGGLLLGGGLLILLGILHKRMAFTSTVVAAVLYTVFVVGRVLSIVLDGLPAEGLVKATVVEAVLGIAAIVALIVFREKNPAGSTEKT